jgi:hypothetical protein
MLAVIEPVAPVVAVNVKFSVTAGVIGKMPAASAPVVPVIAPKVVVPVISVFPLGASKAAGEVVNPVVVKLTPPVASLVKLTVPALPPVVMTSAFAAAAHSSGPAASATAVRRLLFIPSLPHRGISKTR